MRASARSRCRLGFPSAAGFEEGPRSAEAELSGSVSREQVGRSQASVETPPGNSGKEQSAEGVVVVHHGGGVL